eukprot:1040881-Prymnesium_polylepis.1
MERTRKLALEIMRAGRKARFKRSCRIRFRTCGRSDAGAAFAVREAIVCTGCERRSRRGCGIRQCTRSRVRGLYKGRARIERCALSLVMRGAVWTRRATAAASSRAVGCSMRCVMKLFINPSRCWLVCVLVPPVCLP